jgi:hypothetical protein
MANTIEKHPVNLISCSSSSKSTVSKNLLLLLLTIVSFLLTGVDIAYAFATNEIVTYGVPEITKGVIEAATSFVNTKAFVDIISVIVGFCAVYVVFNYGFYQKDWRKTIGYFLCVALIYGMFIQVRVNVTVINKYPPNQSYTINNVPWGLGYLASVFTNFSDQISSKFDQLFSIPDSFKYSQYGVGHPFRLVGDTIANATPSSQYLIENLQAYFEDCSIDDDYINGTKNWDNFWTAPDLMAEIQHDAYMDDFPTMIYVKSGGSWTSSSETCATAYTKISQQYNDDYLNSIKEINIALYGTENPTFTTLDTQYDEVNSVFGFASQSAAQSVQNAALLKAIDAIYDAAAIKTGVDPTVGSLSNAIAEAQQRQSLATSGWLSAKNLPILRGVFELILYGSFPLIFFFMMTPWWGLYLRNYITYMLWLASWGPTFSILNYATVISAKNAFAKAGYSALTGTNTGTSIVGMINLAQVSADWDVIVSSYIGMVPLITLIIITGASAYGMTSLASSMKSSADSAGSSAGSQAAVGVYTMGNVSMNKEDIQRRLSTGYVKTNEGYVSDKDTISSGEKEIGFDNFNLRGGNRRIELRNDSESVGNINREIDNIDYREKNQKYQLGTVDIEDGKFRLDTSKVTDTSEKNISDRITSSKVINETTDVKGKKFGNGDAQITAISGLVKTMENGYQEVNIVDDKGNTVKGIYNGKNGTWSSMRIDKSTHSDITMDKDGLGDYIKELRDNKHFIAAEGLEAIRSRLEQGESVRILETRDPSNNALATFQIAHGGGVSHSDTLNYDFGKHQWTGNEKIEKGHEGNHKYTDSNGHTRTIQFDGGTLTTIGKGDSKFSTYDGLVTDNGKSYKAIASLDSNGNIVSINETKGSESNEKDLMNRHTGERIIDEKTHKILRDFSIMQYGTTAGLLSGNPNVAGLVSDINAYKNNRGEWDSRNKAITDNIVSETDKWFQSHDKTLSSSKTSEGIGWSFIVKGGYDATQAEEHSKSLNNLSKQVALEVHNAAINAWNSGLRDDAAERFITNQVGDWYRENIAKPAGMIVETEKIAPAGSPLPPSNTREGGQPPERITMTQ